MTLTIHEQLNAGGAGQWRVPDVVPDFSGGNRAYFGFPGQGGKHLYSRYRFHKVRVYE